MKYVLLIYDEERTWGKLSPADQQAMMAEYRKFSEEVKASGQYVAGSQLHPVSAASSVPPVARSTEPCRAVPVSRFKPRSPAT